MGTRRKPLTATRVKRRNADAAAFGHGMHLRHGDPCGHCDHESERCRPPPVTPPAGARAGAAPPRCTGHLRHPHLLRPPLHRPCTRTRRVALGGRRRCHHCPPRRVDCRLHRHPPPACTPPHRRYRKRRRLPLPLRIRHRLPPPGIHIHPRRIPVVPHTVLVHPIPPDPIRRQEITSHLVVCRRTVQRVGTCAHAVGCRRYHCLTVVRLSFRPHCTKQADSPPSWKRFGHL